MSQLKARCFLFILIMILIYYSLLRAFSWEFLFIISVNTFFRGGSIKVRNGMLYIAVMIEKRGAPPLKNNLSSFLIPKEQKYI